MDDVLDMSFKGVGRLSEAQGNARLIIVLQSTIARQGGVTVMYGVINGLLDGHEALWDEVLVE